MKGEGGAIVQSDGNILHLGLHVVTYVKINQNVHLNLYFMVRKSVSEVGLISCFMVNKM